MFFLFLLFYFSVDLNEHPIEVLFEHLQPDSLRSPPLCSYWSYEEERWSQAGCHVAATNRTHTTCHCTHLTHFAVLMDMRDVVRHFAAHHRLALTIITVVCSTLSIVCIVATLLCFRFVKMAKRNGGNGNGNATAATKAHLTAATAAGSHSSLSASASGSSSGSSSTGGTTKDLTVITTHLCMCLLASLCVFLVGVCAQQVAPRGRLCQAVAVASHYFFLCSFVWMLLEAVQLYVMLVRIFALARSPIRLFCTLAYGAPALVVLAAKLYDHYALDERGYATNDHCWLSSGSGVGAAAAAANFNLFAFVAPVTAILVANLAILVVVVCGMTARRRGTGGLLAFSSSSSTYSASSATHKQHASIRG